MIELHEVTLIDAAPEAVWKAIHNYSRRMEWDTMLRRVAVDGVAPTAESPVTSGSEVTQWSRWLAGGVKMIARYDECVPPTDECDSVATVQMVAGPWFFRSFHARSVLKRREDGFTRCEASYRFECRPLGLRWIVNRAVTWMFHRETAARWKSLKSYVESQA